MPGKAEIGGGKSEDPSEQNYINQKPGRLAVAKNTKRRSRRFTLRRVRMAAAVTIGALASFDVVVSPITAVSANGYRLVSIKNVYSISGLGAAIDDAFQFGVAHSDYSAAEIEECLEATAAIDVGDKVAQEQANRLVRTIGTVTGGGTNTAGSGIQYNSGNPVKTRLNWKIGIGDTLVGWVRNGSGVVYTTGAILSIQGDLWLQDAA